MSLAWISGDRVRDAMVNAGKVKTQNTLMRMPDKIAAVNLQALEADEQEAVFAELPVAKVRRIRGEISYLRRMSITREVAEEMMRSFESAFAGDNVKKSIKPYIRSKKNRNNH